MDILQYYCLFEPIAFKIAQKNYLKLQKNLCKMADQKDTFVDVEAPVAFWVEDENLLLPCTESVPAFFAKMFGNVGQDVMGENEANIPIDMIIEDIAVFKHIQNHMFVDVLIGYIAKDLDIVQLCSLINATSAHIGISKDTVIKCLKTHIENVGTDTYVWNQMANKTEYTYYQFKKRNWPVKKQNNIDWQTIAKKIGLVEKVYPGEAAKAKERKFWNPKAKDPNEDNPVEEKKHEKEGKDEPNHLDLAEEVKRLDEQEEELDVGSDLEDEDDDADLLQLLNDKEKQVKRDEKLRKLRLESNYATYGIPNIKEIESRTGFTKADVANVFDAAIAIGQRELAVLYACRLFVSRKYYHLAIKNVPFMERIKKLMGENLRIHKLIKYVMSYSFYMMLKEERLLGSKITKNNRAIMDEDEFRALPVFDGELEESPYCTEIYHNNKEKNLREQLPMYLHGERRFTDKKEFSRRLNILTGNMLKDIDLSEHGAFLTGSSLIPCVVTNPLEDNFKQHDDTFATYIENYYPSYDSVSSYRDKFEDAKAVVVELFTKSFPSHSHQYTDIKDDDLFILNMNTMTETFPKAFTHEMNSAVDTVTTTYNEFLLIEKKLADLDIAIVATSREEYDKNVHTIFAKIRANLPEGPEHHIYLYKQPIKYGFKWVLKGPGAKRPIDFFKIWTPAHVLLHKFHLNIVRFWWDGQKVRALSSGVCAALTGVNQWYRWFSNNKDPMSIVLKNMQRGYTTLLNTKEIEILKVYLSEVDKYKHLVGKFVIGKIHKNHTIFGHEGGIRYRFPEMLIVCDQYIDVSQYWANPIYVLKRLGCSLETNSYGKIVVPKMFAFESIIRDLLD